METDSFPEKSQNRHTLTRLSAREDVFEIAFDLYTLQVSLIATNFALTLQQCILIYCDVKYFTYLWNEVDVFKCIHRTSKELKYLNPLTPEFSFKYEHTLYIKCE